MRRLAAGLLFLIFLVSSIPSRAGTESGGTCDAPQEFATADGPLGQLAAAIAGGGPVSIFALGSATTVGTVTVAGQSSGTVQVVPYPHYMVRSLQAALPKVQFNLTVRGGRGMTAEEMLPLLQAALDEHRYSLVLWQTGTVEAVRGLRPDGLLSVLQAGLDKIRDAGADLVLIDPQFSRFLRANTDLDPYENVLQQTAAMPGVLLFHRFELMRTWANDGRIDLERTQKADRDKALEELNYCLGQVLARFVLSGVDIQKK